ncbi:TetR/AcrR family transcriptional regulator [Streptomyces caniscabiei]|uniref:TetR/AcrR family transcriptional regulator n=1 Tax=Streptomyces caniscabiei TaxID=2746961 RepID=A0ABU4N6I2_9ACTN|nr:TetR/AcrR family transcriptional regulator [Streptomyces caniscabiei]MBE4740345.1 TetR/AcrR family transcriptional regulator [Streptomyces caniscabiei]MBE4759597.1 TetR/AcrR family transcriptional regulator [Streptomyces caniscabiei]MBE4788646.1 TetR/AcrR family transcriptional regulator [Streptomyces caniscabiei]MBE4797874.1 TetR/AcrR family transcriptional regulator [Streptomyces caniscabiei]MDX2946225.1 TetR/AcrR family transcriptional regulator [Streptomyces caniscabiei]
MTSTDPTRSGERGGRHGRGRGSRADAEVPPAAAGRPRDPAIEEAIIRATRRRLATDGYSSMTIGDIVAEAGVTRPTLYRRWANKYDLVVDAIRYGLRTQREAYPPLDLERLEPREAFVEAVRRLDPRHHNERAMALHGNFMAEVEQAPGLLEQLREHGVRPRCEELLLTLVDLQRRGAVRRTADLDMAVSLCFGSYFADYLRTGREVPAGFAEQVAATVWPAIAVDPDADADPTH